MPHRCVKCGSLFEDDSSVIRDGCSCGSRAFLYVRVEKTKISRHVESEGDGKYSVDISSAFERKKAVASDAPVESPEDGCFEINVEQLLKEKKA